MDLAATSPGETQRRLHSPKDTYTSRIRLMVVLILCFAVLPAALLLSVGVLMLALGHQARDMVFGVLILSLAATLVAGITATLLYARRNASLARLQDEFVQKVSHDLRTPLTSIRMFVETLSDGRLTDPARIRECLDVLSTETERLTAMVERLLEWAKMESGKRRYHATRARPALVVETAMRALDPQVKAAEMEGAKVRVECAIADHLPDLDVDLDAMSEALLNVMQNALHYTGAEKEIRVRVVQLERDVLITIADNGPGIAKHEQRKIFEKFYRVLDPANPNVEGTGLGLAMVHHIVRAHRGRISVESELGHGATFHIMLPAFGHRVEAG